MKRLLLAFGSFALVALLGVTMIGRIDVDAQDSATPATSATPAVGGSEDKETLRERARDTYMATLAEKLGVSQEELEAAIAATNEELGVEGMAGRGDMMPGRMGGRGGMDDDHGSDSGMKEGPTRAGLMRVDPAAAAAFVGMTEDELKAEIAGGETFVEVALETGKTTDEVRAFLIEQATAAIDERLQEVTADDSATSGDTEVPASPASTPTATATA